MRASLLLLLAAGCIAPVYSSYGPYVETTSTVGAVATSGATATGATGTTGASATTAGATTGSTASTGAASSGTSSTGAGTTSGGKCAPVPLVNAPPDGGQGLCTPNADAGLFGQPSVAYPLDGTGSATGVVTADFNRDGFLDLAAITADTVTVLINNRPDGGQGLSQTWSWAPVAPDAGLDGGPKLSGLGVADFNQDCWPDLAVVDQAGGRIYLAFGNGDGTFTPAASSWPVTDGDLLSDGGRVGPSGMAITQLSRDAGLDAVVAEQGLDTVSGDSLAIVHWQDGGFRPPQFIDLPISGPYQVLAGDLNGDGKPDLVATGGFNVALVLSNDGGYTPTFFDAGAGTVWAALGDLRRSGTLDIAAAGDTCALLCPFMGTFLNLDGMADDFQATPYIRPPDLDGFPDPLVALADINGDGYLDAVGIDTYGRGLIVTLNAQITGNAGSLDFAGRYSTVPHLPGGFALGDFTGDGWPDVAVTYATDREVAIYPNLCTGP